MCCRASEKVLLAEFIWKTATARPDFVLNVDHFNALMRFVESI